MSIEFDPAKDASNLRKHGVSLVEGDGVPDDPLVLVVEDTDSEGEQRYVGLGRNFVGQICDVVYTYRGENIRLISVRKPSSKEVKAYEEGI